MFTHQTVHDILQNRWESDEPDKVLQALRPFDGKPITKRLCDKMPGGSERWRLRREYGMTHLETRDYMQSGGNQGFSILLAHSEAAVPLDTAYVQDRNSCYYSARVARNHGRMEAMNDKQLLDQMAAVLNRARAALDELEAVKRDFAKLTEYGEPLSHDAFELERACGLREPIKQ